jgi:hypothetical protein
MTIFERAWEFIKSLLTGFWNKDGPAITAWVEKFASDEGKLLLATALTSAQAVFSKQTTMQDAGAALVKTMETQGVTVAENDALDAIRTQLNYVQTQATGN